MLSLLFVAALAAATPRPTAAPVPPQATRTLSGVIRDPSGNPLASVRIAVLEANRRTESEPDGRYRLSDLPTGTFSVSFALVGYAPQVKRVVLTEQDQVVDIVLKTSTVELQEMQVTATPLATDPLSSPQPVSILSGEDLALKQKPSLGETLDGMPGVHNYGTGPGISKPVIRGLTSNRVLVLDDGQRLETQQWGDEHAPQVETASAERVEVIRGPASVLYGSDAIGGVINVVQKELPDALGKKAFAHGTISGAYTSNNRQPDGSFLIEGADGAFGFRGTLSGRTAQDLRTPTYTLWNSGLDQIGGSLGAGLRGSWGSLAATYTQRNEKLSLTDEDSTATPTQRIRSNRARVNLTLPFSNSRLEVMAGWERNNRREFEDATTTEVGLGLLSKTYSGDVRYHHAPIGPFTGIIGGSLLHTTFDKFGEETLIPDSRATSGGIFLFEQAVAGPWDFSFGARYDHRNLDVDDDADLGVTAQTRRYNSVTGNVGILYRVSEPVALVLNVGRGYRAPSTFDLFSNGVHEGTVAFEHGNPDLTNETSLNTDFAVRVQSRDVALEVGAFANYINDYIYTVPTGQTDPGSGFEIYDVTQGDARLIGFESSIQYHPATWLHLQGTADYVRGQNRTTNEPLPNMPPFRATYTARLEGKGSAVFQRPYVSFGGETNARQSRLDPAEAAFYAQAFDGAGYVPQSYTIANAGAGFALPTGSTSTRFDFQLLNAFNTAYAPPLSRIKTNAPLPGMGRALIARVSADF